MRKPFEPSKNDIRLSSVLHALSDPKRLQMVMGLGKEGEENCAVYHDLMPKSTLTHHLKVLRESGVTQVRIEGTQHFYSLRYDDLEELFPGMLKAILQISPEMIQ